MIYTNCGTFRIVAVRRRSRDGGAQNSACVGRNREQATVAAVDASAEQSQSRRGEVREAMREFVIAALGYLNENCAPPTFGPALMPRLVRQQQELFQLERPEQWLRCPTAGAARSTIRKLPAFERLQEALTSDPSVARQLGNLVGSPFSLSFIDFDMILEARLVAPMIEETRAYEFLDSMFSVLADPVISALFSSTVERTLLVPLHGFVGLSGEVELGDGRVVRPISDEELAMLHDWGILPGVHSRLAIQLNRSDQWCIAQRWQLPKQIGQRDPEDVLPAVPDMDDAADRFVAAVLLTGPGPVSRGSFITFDSADPLHLGVGGSAQIRPLQGLARDRRPFVLHAGNLAEVLDCYVDLGHPRVQSQRPLRLALRRFCAAAMRTNDEDPAIDLMIAAESLFLSDTSDDRGELGLRLALRAALFVRLEGIEPTGVHRFMKAAYNARSRIVHGAEVRGMKSLDGSTVDLAGFVGDLELVMRTTVKRVVKMTGSSEWRGNYWTELLDAALDVGSTQS